MPTSHVAMITEFPDVGGYDIEASQPKPYAKGLNSSDGGFLRWPIGAIHCNVFQNTTIETLRSDDGKLRRRRSLQNYVLCIPNREGIQASCCRPRLHLACFLEEKKVGDHKVSTDAMESQKDSTPSRMYLVELLKKKVNFLSICFIMAFCFLLVLNFCVFQAVMLFHIQLFVSFAII